MLGSASSPVHLSWFRGGFPTGGGDGGCIDFGRCMGLNVDFVETGNDITHDNQNLRVRATLPSS